MIIDKIADPYNRGTRFSLSRDELLTLPEFVLLSLFPNGLFPEGHMGGGFSDGDAVQVDVGDPNSSPKPDLSSDTLSCTSKGETDQDQEQSISSSSWSGSTHPDLMGEEGRPSADVLGGFSLSLNLSKSAWAIRATLEDEAYFSLYCEVTNVHRSQYDPASLQYMLDFFRNVAQSIPTDASGSGAASPENDVVPLDPGARDDSSKRAGIIVLREDLDFYAIPHKKGINQVEMMEVKRAAARALLKQDGIFSGLKRSDEPGTTEAHLIEMLTAG